MKIAFAAAILLAAAPAAAADRNFGVSGFDRVRVEGPFTVRLTVGVAPYARASGSTRALDALAIDVQGRTLVVRPNRSSWGGYSGEDHGPVEIAIGTHELTAAWLNGSGSLAIDRVKGLAFDLSVQGAGSAAIGHARIDQLKVGISGAGNVQIGGSAMKLTSVVRGMSGLDASRLEVKDAAIGAEGPSTVKAKVSGTAKVDAVGAAAVILTGGPACTVTTRGSASVSGCRTQR